MKQLSKTVKVLLLSSVCAVVAIGAVVGISLAGGDKKDNVKVKFDVDGGVAITDVTAKKGEEVTLPTPERKGYKFEGWYLNEKFDGSPVTKIVADKNVTYYAKWSQLSVITLDLNGGALSTTTIYVENGANVYDAVKAYAPTKDGFVFGAWFNGDKELNKNTRITEEGITLKAEYKVAYTVEVYVENIDNDEYALSEELTYTAYDYVNTEITVELDVDGCSQIEHANEVLTKTLSETASDNVFAVYYKRDEYKVIFNPNAPDGSNTGSFEQMVKYGAEVEIPEDQFSYLIEGYCMLGWSTGADSKEIVYKTNLDNLLYEGSANDGVKNEESQKIVITRPTMLYGVWQAGATDMFGGNDYIYAFEGDADVVYLARGDFFFKGEYRADTREFLFYDYTEDELGTLVLRGTLFENGKFLYNDPNRQGQAVLYKYYEADPMDRVDQNVKIRYDSLNVISYTVYDPETGEKVEESTGTYESIALSEYKAVFTEGPMAGQTIHFMIGQLTMSGPTGTTTLDGFLIRNDEEYNMGQLLLSGVLDNGFGGYTIAQSELVYIELNGYGQATYIMQDQKAVFNYLKGEDGNYYFSDANGKSAGVIRLTADTNIAVAQNGYFLYDQNFDKTFTLANGGTLTLDGFATAVFEKDGKTISSYYLAETMPMGGALISIADAGDSNKAYKFLINFDAEDANVYTARQVLDTYAEYYYKNSSNVYYAPMLVIDETKEGWASIYGYTAEGKFAKVLEGTYTAIEDGDFDGMYQFTVINTFDEPVLNDPVDYYQVKSFIFAMNDKILDYDVHYWFEQNGTESYCTYYVEADGEGSLMLVGGFAYYKIKPTMKALVGVYSVGMGYISFSDVSGHIYYFVCFDNGTFSILDYVPFIAYLLKSDNHINTDVYLNVDGLGGALYYYYPEVEEGEESKLTILDGTTTETGEQTEFGSKVYLFESEDGTISFEYIAVSLGESIYFLYRHALKAGRYVDQNDVSRSLTIDGFCYNAIYNDGSKMVEGNYYITEEGVIKFINKDRTFTLSFDLVDEENRVYTMRGQEENVYIYFENGDNKDIYFEMDGYGNLSVFTLVLGEEGYERNYITEEGRYEQDGDYFTLIYEMDGKPAGGVFENRNKTYYAIDKNPYIVLMAEQELIKDVLIDVTDWAVLILDNFGNAIKYNSMGQKQKGNYTLVTDNLLYFINEDSTDACIYDYDMETGEASPIELSEKTYYTDNLQSLVFSKYGFAIFNGDQENTIFYTVDYCAVENCGGEDDKGKPIKCPGHITIHRYADEGEDLAGKTVSKYGFVEEEFGKFEETKEYNGTTYYRSKGSDIRFDRVSDNLALYPLKIENEKTTTTYQLTGVQFAPGGGVEFTVSGVADVTVTTTDENGQVTGENVQMNCTVGREIIDGEAKLYVLIENYFRFYIDATYTGINDETAENTFEVNGLQYYQYLYSMMYLDEFYRTYTRYGAARAYALENEYGAVILTCNINELGEEVDYFVSAEFGSKTDLYDTNGENLTKIEKAKWLSIGSISYAAVTMSDGYEYRLYFGQSQNPYLGMTGYYVYAFVRVQELEAGEYTVEIGKALYTDIMGVALDDVFFMSVTKGDELDTDDKYVIDSRKSMYMINGVWYCVDREYYEDPQYALEATYYMITFEENEDGTLTDGEDEKEIYSTYKSVTLQISTAKIMRESNDVRRYAEIIEVENEDGEMESRVAMLDLHGNLYVVKECTYDEATKTYTVVIEDSNRTFTVKVVDEYHVVIEEI